MPLSRDEIVDVLKATQPFDKLSEQAVAKLAAGASERAMTSGETVVELGKPTEYLKLVHAGEVEIRSATGKIFARLRPGQAFGVRALLGNGRASYRAVAIRDGNLILIPKDAFLSMREIHPDFDKLFEPIGGGRAEEPAQVASGQGKAAGIDLMTMTTRDLMTSGPVTMPIDTTALSAAKRMRDYNISCLPIMDGDRLVGIVTDGDLRDRVLADGRESSVPIAEIMTANPVTVETDALAFDALVLMMQRNISHLPITEDSALAGILTHTNLVRAQSRSAVYMIGEIHRGSDIEGMAAIVRQIPDLLVSLIESGANAYKIGRIITSICDAVTHRLIAMADQKLGPAPVPYVWLACGSQGRQEQTGVSDQDNCLFFDDGYDEASHGAYFTQFAKFVCDGLDKCGYVYCPGEMMAMTPKWRQPVRVWKTYYRSWIERPEPMAQMLASVMFDLRPIWGKAELFESVQAETLGVARKNSIFIAHMLSNSLTHTPPLGMFGNLAVIRTAENRNTIDMKHSGVVPIVDIARMYALMGGIPEVNTHERLEAGRDASVLSEKGARDLLAAFEFIAITRLRHQARQIRAGKKPDNFMLPEEISHLERSQLKDAFGVVKTIQSSLSSSRQIGAR